MDDTLGFTVVPALAESVLLIDLQGPGDTLASRFRHRIAEVAVSDERWLPLLPTSGAPLPEEELAPSGTALDTLSLPDWVAPRFANPAWRHISYELLRLGYDPSIMVTAYPGDPGDIAAAIAGSLLWLTGHAVTWRRPLSPPGLEVVSFETDPRGGFAQTPEGPLSPVRFHDAATALGPSAVSSLAAVLARACGEPVAPGPQALRVSEGVPERQMRPLGGALRWVELAFLSAFDPQRSLDEAGRAEAIRDVLLPAVRSDFSYGVAARSAAARARDRLISGAPRI